MIKPKIGNCETCGHMGGLIAKKCNSCYWKHRASQKKEKNKPKVTTKKEQPEDPDLKTWFLNQIMIAPRNCEECGTSLKRWLNFMPFATIAHILPKRQSQFPEVATHPDNRMFFCGDCHTNLDYGFFNPEDMKSIDIMRERFRKIEPFIAEENKHKIPNYLTENKNGK